MHIHGLVLDSVVKHYERRYSAFSTSVCEYGVARFPDGAWMVTLPKGTACSNNFDHALRLAAERQHEALWGEQ